MVIFWLFVALALATALSFIAYAVALPAAEQRYRITVLRAVGGDLAAPVAAWCILHGLALRNIYWIHAGILGGTALSLLLSEVMTRAVTLTFSVWALLVAFVVATLVDFLARMAWRKPRGGTA